MMASKDAALGGNLDMEWHKDICGVLSKWRQVVKDGVSPDSCPADLLADSGPAAMNAGCPDDAEGAPAGL